MTIVDIRSQAAKDAERVRDEFWDGSLPVDPVRIAKAVGIRVVDVALPKDVSGAIKKVGDNDPVIYLEKTDHANRKRFSCAHELGHYFENAGKGDFDYIDYRNGGTSPREQYANEFGARLLMPEAEVKALVNKYSGDLKGVDLAIEARRFGVSALALQLRIRNS